MLTAMHQDPNDRPAFDAALNWVRRAVDAGQLPSAVLGVATSTGPVLIEAFGRHDGRSTTIDDNFALFSLTKPIVGLATLRLVEQGLLSLRTPLRDVVPGLSADITLWHLLTHTSGIAEGSLTPDDGLLAELTRAGTGFAPGTAIAYSNLAFVGIAEILRSVTGTDLDTALAALPVPFTFDPHTPPVELHGTTEVGLDYPALAKARHPAAGLVGQAEDLLNLGSLLLRKDPALIHPTTLAAMTTPQTLGLPFAVPDPTRSRREYGLTWCLRPTAPELLERRVYGHTGWSGNQWWIYPDLDACLVLLTNMMEPERHGVDADNLLNAFTTALPGS
ncbi:esterase [Acrocarpospora corrugata]|uniref:Esterase n=1 Tax=Acrocarpospora corrugata TaxID=35763 RepID=A0A5M3W2G4_9ACTN|nr:esterase [Acrocarpospora corrugata]